VLRGGSVQVLQVAQSSAQFGTGMEAVRIGSANSRLEPNIRNFRLPPSNSRQRSYQHRLQNALTLVSILHCFPTSIDMSSSTEVKPAADYAYSWRTVVESTGSLRYQCRTRLAGAHAAIKLFIQSIFRWEKIRSPYLSLSGIC
jgi:hypothetical protein